MLHSQPHSTTNAVALLCGSRSGRRSASLHASGRQDSRLRAPRLGRPGRRGCHDWLRARTPVVTLRGGRRPQLHISRLDARRGGASMAALIGHARPAPERRVRLACSLALHFALSAAPAVTDTHPVGAGRAHVLQQPACGCCQQPQAIEGTPLQQPRPQSSAQAATCACMKPSSWFNQYGSIPR